MLSPFSLSLLSFVLFRSPAVRGWVSAGRAGAMSGHRISHTSKVRAREREREKERDERRAREGVKGERETEEKPANEIGR